MTVYECGADGFIKLNGERVIALGFFDGVHIGHRSLLKRAKKAAESKGLPFAVFTFRAESEAIKNGAQRLYTTDEKLGIIEECGADETILADFDSMRAMTAEEFALGFLFDRCGCRTAVAGRDFRFGKGAAGDIRALAELMQTRGGECTVVEDVSLFGKKVSTSAIKEYMRAGDLKKANEMLGAPYFLEAEVEHGRGVGRTLGFPTLNCPLGGKTGLLKHGVYRSAVRIGEKLFPALTNVGVCPTFDVRPEHAETFLLDFDADVYGNTVRILLYEYLREERRFDSAEALKKQINSDIQRVKDNFENGRKLD